MDLGLGRVYGFYMERKRGRVYGVFSWSSGIILG